MKYLWVCLFSLSIGATTFQLQPIEKQIQESDGVLLGHFLRAKAVELENGSIATQMVFKITQETGLQNELLGLNEIIVHYPGGTFNGKTVKVEGVPEFVSGEKVVLFIRNVENRFWGMNLGFGTYKVINYGPQTILVNSLFPDDPRVGQLSFESFEESIKHIKGSSLKVVQTEFHPVGSEVSQRAPASVSKKEQQRSTASSAESTEHDGTQPSNTFWLIALLGAAGGLFRLFRFRS